MPVSLRGDTLPDDVQAACLFGGPLGRLRIQIDHLLRQRQALHGKPARPDSNRPFARANPTLSVFRLKAQQASTGRLQIDPDNSLDVARPDAGKDQRLIVEASLQVLERGRGPECHSKHATLWDRPRHSPLNPEGISRI